MDERNESHHAGVSRFSCTVETGTSPLQRLDRYVSETLKILTRSQIKARKLRARLNGKEVKVSKILKGGENLELFWEEAEPEELIPEDLPLDIIYEDERTAVINKAQGMVVHPGAGNRRGTLANALYFHALERLQKTEKATGLRPGIVHRLDKDTSGLIISAWDEEALAFLAGQFKKRKVKKTYAALVEGCPEKSGRIETFISRSKRDRKLFAVSEERGKHSLTYYKLVRTWGDYSLVLLRPKTGRTHQLRVHLKHIGHPVIGDPLYGAHCSRFPHATLMLHAKRLSLVLPGGRNEKTSFRISFPSRFYDILPVPDKSR